MYVRFRFTRPQAQQLNFLPAFVAEHGRLEQQQGATQDLAKELNEVRARASHCTNVSGLHSGAQSRLLTHTCRPFPV